MNPHKALPEHIIRTIREISEDPAKMEAFKQFLNDAQKRREEKSAADYWHDIDETLEHRAQQKAIRDRLEFVPLKPYTFDSYGLKSTAEYQADYINTRAAIESEGMTTRVGHDIRRYYHVNQISFHNRDDNLVAYLAVSKPKHGVTLSSRPIFISAFADDIIMRKAVMLLLDKTLAQYNLTLRKQS